MKNIDYYDVKLHTTHLMSPDNIVELFIYLVPALKQGKEIKFHTFGRGATPIYKDGTFTWSESEKEIYNCSFTITEEELQLIDNTSLINLVAWMYANPVKVEKIYNMKAFL